PLGRNPLWRIHDASSPSPIMFRVKTLVGLLLDGCFRIGYALEGRVRRVARSTNKSIGARSTCSTPDRRQKESFRSIQLHHGRLKEAFTPGAANGQTVVKRLPAHPNLGHSRIGIVVQ